MIKTSGTIQDKRIDLDRAVPIPAGSRVHLEIDVEDSDLQRRLNALRETFGALAEDEGFAAAMEEVERQRHERMPREVDFDADTTP